MLRFGLHFLRKRMCYYVRNLSFPYIKPLLRMLSITYIIAFFLYSKPKSVTAA